MNSTQRIVIATPLTELWNAEGGPMGAHRAEYVGEAEIAHLLQQGSSLVVADVGHPLRWISETDRFSFWKTEVRCHLVSPDADGFRLDDYPGGYCYVASVWTTGSSASIIVLEKHH